MVFSACSSLVMASSLCCLMVASSRFMRQFSSASWALVTCPLGHNLFFFKQLRTNPRKTAFMMLSCLFHQIGFAKSIEYNWQKILGQGSTKQLLQYFITKFSIRLASTIAYLHSIKFLSCNITQLYMHRFKFAIFNFSVNTVSQNPFVIGICTKILHQVRKIIITCRYWVYIFLVNKIKQVSSKRLALYLFQISKAGTEYSMQICMH